jgi:broad specificity phosphatase PhoE
MTVFLVRHGRSLPDPTRPASEWPLDPAGYDDVWALRDRLPAGAAWCSSPEPKALATAELLTDGEIGVVPELREHERAAGWLEDFPDVVARAFADPASPATAGWEPLQRCADRVVPAVRRLVEVHEGQDLVLVGHGTAWTLALASLTGVEPDLGRWVALRMPDVWTVEV